MRHVTISKTIADLHRLEFVDEPVASFSVSERGIEHVNYGEDRIPRDVAVLDPRAEGAERVTLDNDPIRWADLLPLAYRTGDHQVTVSEQAELEETKARVAPEASVRDELEALPR